MRIRKMNYEAFNEELKSTLERHITTKMKLIEVDKNNGTTREALVFYEEEHSAALTIYLKELYQNHQNGMELEDIVKQILELQQRANSNNSDSKCTINSFDSQNSIVQYYNKQK